MSFPLPMPTTGSAPWKPLPDGSMVQGHPGEAQPSEVLIRLTTFTGTAGPPFDSLGGMVVVGCGLAPRAKDLQPPNR